ncbi:hypothetical protein [Streptomyces sp. NPDC001903]|uniref:hypothetical protein n=1 Tax=Streptomyces sp. NPDC001903 TaxID=3364622 RepID=UPI0036CE7AFA
MSPAQADVLTPAEAGQGQICIKAHVAGIGDQPWACNNAHNNETEYAGTIGQNRAIEGMWVYSTVGIICADAHVRDKGWQGGRCTAFNGTSVWVGTSGENRPMEALRLWLPSDEHQVRMAGNAHVQNQGWDKNWTQDYWIELGTTGRARNLEAVVVIPVLGIWP